MYLPSLSLLGLALSAWWAYWALETKSICAALLFGAFGGIFGLQLLLDALLLLPAK